MEVELKKAKNTDIPFLLLLRAVTMNDYLQASGLDTDEKSQLDRIQYHFDDANIVYYEDKRIGLFKFYFHDLTWHVIQIQILPEYQGKGIGAKLLVNLKKLADKRKQRVILSVLKSNPAMSLYQKLGFIAVAESDTEFTMEYVPKNC
jgi:ribosomal protein S18 acetylase RimI-like enzyme